MNLFEKIKDLLRKDSGDNNESTKLRYVVRIILILCVVYNVGATISSGAISEPGKVAFYVAFFFMFVFIVILSYVLKTTPLLVIFNLGMLLWIIATDLSFGWSGGAQTLLVVLLVLIYFSRYENSLLKIIYSFFLFGVRIALYLLTKDSQPVFTLNHNGILWSQILNSALAFCAISILCFIFSRESQALEGKLVEYNVQLVNQANTDPLTGLNNRRKTMECLESLIADSRTNGLCVAIADIDFFKKVNDTYGHDIGDKVLKSIAQTMLNTLGENCVISRWGGEEFLIVFPNLNGDDAYVMLQDLRSAISKLKFEVKDRSFSITLTYGLSEYDFRSDILSLVKEADNKLYIGKENGRDQVVF